MKNCMRCRALYTEGAPWFDLTIKTELHKRYPDLWKSGYLCSECAIKVAGVLGGAEILIDMKSEEP